LGLGDFPKGTVEWHGIPFQIPAGAPGGDCLRLCGTGHTDWPQAMAGSIPVGRHVAAVYLLHAAIGGRESAEMPCAIWSAKMVGGFDANLSVFEGRQIGGLSGVKEKDLENWHVAWRGQEASGRRIAFGVTRWPFQIDSLVESLSCRSYQGAPMVVLAATAVEEAPSRPSSGTDEEIEGEDDHR
jgi:hypothetical protein